jgi:hypothetical protein
MRNLVRGALLALVMLSSAAWAEDERPWAAGVSPEKQKVALELFREGNAALKESLFPKAAQKYREALKEWDHPAIHYNMALALLNLDQPIEVYEHLQAAMKYGVAPLDTDKFEQARRYFALTEKQVSKVKVACETAGAAVSMDGRPLFVGPGSWDGIVRAGPHSVVAQKEGMLTVEQSRVLPGGDTASFELKLFSADDLTQYKRLWPAWIPWTVVAGGAVILGTAAGLHLSVRDAYNTYDKGILACTNAATQGCVPDLTLAAKRSYGDSVQPVAIAGYLVGGAALATGAVLVYVNRLQPYRVNTSTSVSVAPVLAPGYGGASFSFGF